MSQVPPPVSTTVVNQPPAKMISNLIPRSAATYQKLAQLYRSQAKDFGSMVYDVKELLVQVNSKVSQTTSNINELMKKATKQQDVKQKAGKFLDGKNEELRNKNKNIDSIVSGMKETVSKMNPDELADLPVEKERILLRTFQMLYKVLYQKDVSENHEFKWSVFKKKALKTENGEDFQSRMANINLRSLTEETYSQILALKQDPEFFKLSQNPKYAARLYDLGDWMEYVCKGYQFTNDWKGTQSNYEKIQKNVLRRGLEGVSVKQALAFWKEAHHSAQEFRYFFNDVQSRLMAMEIYFDKNAGKMEEAAKSRKSKIDEINSS